MYSEMMDAFIGEIHVDGVQAKVADLTFAEQRKMRDLTRQLAPDGDVEEAGEQDVIPALITVIKQRTDESFTLEQALTYKPADLAAPPTKPPAKKRS